MLLKLNRNRPRPRLVGFLFIFLGEVKKSNRGRREDVPPYYYYFPFFKRNEWHRKT